jgi:hypothetical protein
MNAIKKEYTREEVCVYKGRKYYVRDNGEIYRQCKEDGIIRKWDEKWTFGKFDPKTGYMLIDQERVHRIVCTAYHGEPVGDRNVVDHIDTNRCNNRPENLRWVSKLENTLLNPITRAKVELICGSVEAFLNNPQLLYGHESENTNFSWMRAVNKEEAKHSLERWKEWAAKPIEDRKPKGHDVGQWIYEGEKPTTTHKPSNRPRYAGPYNSWEEHKAAIEEANKRYYEEQYGCKDSLTPGAKQLDWKTPTEFPQIPQEITATPLQDYLAHLPKGAIYTRNRWGESPVYEAAMSEDGSHLAVVTEISGVTHFALSEVTFENGFFVHKSIRTFFTEEGAQKYFTESLGREWTGGDVMEDYC